jgi:hypothetical protein
VPGRPKRLRDLADVDSQSSLSNRLRDSRFERLTAMADRIRPADRPLRVIDVGGTNAFWRQRGWADQDHVEITLVNLTAPPQEHANIQSVAGDATDLSQWDDGSFDLAFSNSTIEHLFTLRNQAAMAAEMRRVGRSYWVQTPNFAFPIEPHFLFPAWHWLPVDVRVALIRRRRFGWRGPTPDPAEARAAVEEIRILRRREMQALFPDGELYLERIGPFVKSFVATRVAA